MKTDAIIADWIAVDWGTSRLRAWAVTDQGVILAQGASDNGMSTLTPEEYEPTLLALIGSWLGPGETEVIACGMVGSRQGWTEATYQSVPCKPLGQTLASPRCGDKRLKVRIISGLRQDKPADVMRGEETQIAGFLKLNPKFDGILCLPGTHTKWVHVSAGEVVSFQTFMTGELFSSLSQHSVLRHTLGQQGWDDAAFVAAIDDIMSRPERLAARLFSLRAKGLLHDLDAASARARLSGCLIGAELAAARPYWLGQQVAIIGAKQVSEVYEQALISLGVTPIITDGIAMTLAGLGAARLEVKETTS